MKPATEREKRQAVAASDKYWEIFDRGGGDLDVDSWVRVVRAVNAAGRATHKKGRRPRGRSCPAAVR